MGSGAGLQRQSPPWALLSLSPFRDRREDQAVCGLPTLLHLLALPRSEGRRAKPPGEVVERFAQSFRQVVGLKRSKRLCCPSYALSARVVPKHCAESEIYPSDSSCKKRTRS